MKDYKKILEGVVNIINNTEKSDIGFANIRTFIGENCPELKESEDERIRKALIDYFDDANKIDENPLQGYDIHTDKVIAWLEKQCKQTHIDDLTAQEAMSIAVADSEDEDGPKSADKFRPKFREGEWITNGDYTWQIINVTDLDYILQSQDGNTVDDTISHVDEHFHSFTIEDAADCDILVSEHNQPFIYNGYFDTLNVGAYCGLDCSGKDFIIANDLCNCDWTNNNNIKPADKEQRTKLKKAIAEAGYTFDFEKKKLSKYVIDEGKSEMDYCFTKMMNGEKVNPTWSDEDELCLRRLMLYLSCRDNLIDEIKNKYTNWLNSLKERIGG